MLTEVEVVQAADQGEAADFPAPDEGRVEDVLSRVELRDRRAPLAQDIRREHPRVAVERV